MKTKKINAICLVILLLGLIRAELTCQIRQTLSFRLYEGFREDMYSPKTITTLYFNREHTFDELFSPTEQKRETKALQNLYHLNQVHSLLSIGIIIPPSTKSRGFQMGVMCEENLYLTIQSIPGETELFQVQVMGMDNPNDPVHEFPVRVSSASPGYFPFRFRFKKWYVGVLRPPRTSPEESPSNEKIFYHLPVCSQISLPEFNIRKTQYVNQDIELKARVTPRGRIRSVRIVEGHPWLNQSALQTTRRWRFSPSHLKKSIDITIIYKFSLFYW